MKLVTGLGSIEDYIPYVEAGADECFVGYVPESWMEHNPDAPLNRREVRYYNVQIGSMSELLILSDMIRKYSVPVSIAMNALAFSTEQRRMVCEIISLCNKYGFGNYIIADRQVIGMLEQGKGLRVHLSGEYGELNSLILGKMDEMGVRRIIFPRQTEVQEMESMIRKYPGFEYEAFLLNEKCHYTGAYCNSLHCDELCHACRIPYRLDGMCDEEERSSEAEAGSVEDCVGSIDITDYGSDSLEFGGTEDRGLVGSGGCGLCKLWQYKRVGITHLKLVSRGNDTESTLKDIRAIRRALEILDSSGSEDAYIQAMKEEIFPNGCSGVCY